MESISHYPGDESDAVIIVSRSMLSSPNLLWYIYFEMTTQDFLFHQKLLTMRSRVEVPTLSTVNGVTRTHDGGSLQLLRGCFTRLSSILSTQKNKRVAFILFSIEITLLLFENF